MALELCGKPPSVEAGRRDYRVFEVESPDEVPPLISHLVSQKLPGEFNANPVRDIQVLASMYRGKAGIHALNAHLQALLNPLEDRENSLKVGGATYRVGDKVMVRRTITGSSTDSCCTRR